MLKMINEHVVFVAEAASELIGFIAGLVTGHPYDPQIKVLTESFFWVDVVYRRKSPASAHLLNVFSAWGHRNCDLVFMGLPPHTDISDRSMLKRGYRLAERYFVLERA